MALRVHSLAFLNEQAAHPNRRLSKSKRAALVLANESLRQADRLVVLLGGKAGRLGETIVATALLEGILEALRVTGRRDIPVAVFVDAGAFDLFDERLYQERWGQRITFSPIDEDQRAQPMESFAADMAGRCLLIVDLHGEHDGEPQLRIIEEPTSAATEKRRTLITLANLARRCIRSYAARGPLRRYADAVEELFALPVGSIAGEIPQPRILLASETSEDEKRIALLADLSDLTPRDVLITCFFQSVVAAKVYEQWDTVMLALCEWAHQRHPGGRLRFVIPCGDDDLHPNGPTEADLASAFRDFTGVEGNADVTVTRIPALRDLALVLRHAMLTLSNDTGPGHLSGALGVPTITPYLPGEVYSQRVWASTLAHHGVTLPDSSFTHREVEAAVLWNRTNMINAIPPERLAGVAIDCLAARLLR